MNQFTLRHAPIISAVLSGFDRIVLAGSIRHLCCPKGMEIYLRELGLLFKQFGQHMLDVSEEVKQRSLAQMQSTGAEFRYLESSNVSKEDIARQIAKDKNIRDGVVCSLACVENCMSFAMRGNKTTKLLELVSSLRRCTHHYLYQFHPVFGWMNIRLQTWFPFRIQICLNGREWLSRQLDEAGIAYEKADNCFTWIENFDRAQELMQDQLSTIWSTQLDNLVPQIHPYHPTIREHCHGDYYWSCRQSEWASDVIFKDRRVLEPLTDSLLRHGITTFKSPDALRFFGRTTAINGLKDDVSSSLKYRHEGARIKHYFRHNSVKMYNKALTEKGGVLRFEMTMNNEESFRVYRERDGGPLHDKSMRQLRRGMVDFPHRAQVSQQCLDRYMTAMASAANEQRLADLLDSITKPAAHKTQPVRALRPFSPEDTRIIEVVGRGEFAIQGLRNRDLQPHFFDGKPKTPEEARRRSGWITRKLRLLRAHGLISKAKGTHVYQITDQGRLILTAIAAARDSSVCKLSAMAA